MSAVAKPWKVQDSRDRHSNMAHSSLHATAKKGGAGGSFTWGGALDVDYGAAAMPSVSASNKLMVAAAAAAVAPAAVQQAPVAPISDAKQFPTLGAQPAASPATSVRWAAPAQALYQAPPPQAAPPVTAPAKVATQGPPRVVYAGVPISSVNIPPATVTQAAASPAAAAPRVVLGEDMMRTGVEALDATHPRNAFARKPHHKPAADTNGTAPAPALEEAPWVDWTAAGTTSFQQQVIHAVAQNPAHLGPYIAEKPGPSLAALRAMPSPAAYVPNQKMVKLVANQPKIAKPQVMFQRKC